MTLAYLNENATSVAAANWSDSTGFADEAELVFSAGTVGVTSDLDQSGLTNGVHSIEVQATYNADIGVAGTPLQCDVDYNSPSASDAADAEFVHNGPRRVYYQANGGNSECHNYRHTGTGQSYIEGGTIVTLYVVRGAFNANESTVITTATFYGGTAVIENNATGFTSCTVKGGIVTSKRDGTYVVEGGTLVLDIPDASPTLSVTVRQGGRLIVRQANALATLVNDGSVDISQSKRPVTLGATDHQQGPFARLVRGQLNHTITEPTYPAGYQNAGEPLQGGVV